MRAKIDELRDYSKQKIARAHLTDLEKKVLEDSRKREVERKNKLSQSNHQAW